MKKLMITALTAMSVLTAVTAVAESRTFTAASVNVDGMPPSIKVASLATIKLNPDAKEGEGASNIGAGIARQGWDFIALSEDFNYHADLMAPIQNYYYACTWRGKIEDVGMTDALAILAGNKKLDTDGLGFLYSKSLSASNETMTQWNKTNGLTDQGSDELIKKGFRYYLVEIAPGMLIDVYIHHMDAETNEADNAARESQITQLVDIIIASDNKRPIIIMGDTNCRYTRDRLKELLIDRINADPRFDIHDPWVEFQWAEEGGYDAPRLQLGQEAIMTHTYGPQKGEVVDKLFYINNTDANGVTLTANSYRSATDFTFSGVEGDEPLSDHFPVVVNFTITNPNDGVRPGVNYYIRNKATGTFINQGADWGTHAVSAKYGNRIALEEAADDTYYMHTSCGYMKSALYLDGDANDRGQFVIKENDNGYATISIDGNYLTSPANTGEVIATSSTADSDAALWEFLTSDDLKAELEYASETNPIDATFLMPGAGINNKDSDNSSWTLASGRTSTWLVSNNNSATIDGRNNGDSNDNVVIRLYTGASKNYARASYTVTGLPSGIYRLSLDAATANLNDHTFTVNGTSYASLIKSLGNNGNISAADAALRLHQEDFNVTIDNLTVTDGQISIYLATDKSHGSSVSLFADNFRLTYLGQTEEMKVAYKRVEKAMAEVAGMLENLEPDARSFYNNRAVEQAYAQHRLSADGVDEVQRTYEALASATKRQKEIGADFTYAINNWSFEMGWMPVDRNLPYWASHWPTDDWADTGVKPNGDGNYNCTNADGEYLFNTYGPNIFTSGPVSQTVTGLPDGVYEIKASLASDAGYKLYVFGNGSVSEAVEATDKTTMVDATVRAIVRGGTLTLGAVAGGSDGQPVIAINSADEVWGDTNANGQSWNSAWYKADNFRLKYIASIGFENVQLAINDATAKAEACGVTVDYSEYQELVDNYAIPGDGLDYVIKVYEMLADAVKAQDNLTAGQDMTPAIINNSFEMAIYGLPLQGWEALPSSDTGVYPTSNDTYHVDNTDGEYLFNTWWQGRPITQTITDLPAGRYRLTVSMSSGDNASATPPYVFLTVNGEPSDAFELPNDQTVWTECSYEFNVTDGMAVIGALGGNSDGSYTADGYWWYKADNFRLTYVDALPTLDIEGRYYKSNRTAVLTVTDSNGNIPDGLTILYAITTDGSTPTTVEDIYDNPIELVEYADETVSIWAEASAPGFVSTGMKCILSDVNVNHEGETVAFKPVVTDNQLQAGNWYLIISLDSDGTFHALGHGVTEESHNEAYPVTINTDGNITGDEDAFESVHEFVLSGNGEDGWTLTSKNGQLTYGGSPVSRAATGATITLGNDPVEGTNTVPAAISIDGNTLGFNSASRTFGFSENHTSPVMLYTTGNDMNTGVDDVTSDSNNGNKVYYNLRGVRVDNPAPGLYIVKQGDKTAKVLVK